MSSTSANDHFGSNNGTYQYYRHSLSSIVYTDGVQHLADTCGAYWLIDLIISHQLTRSVAAEAFQVWVLTQAAGNKYDIECTDGNGRRVAAQEIPFSDFPYQQATLWLVDNCLMLPCEY